MTPRNRPPTSPQTFLIEEFLLPLSIGHLALADKLSISANEAFELVHGKPCFTAQLALKLEKAFGMSAEFWLLGQMEHDLWHARKAASGG